jgi:Cu(I)/Ag(I) efflux system membrane protein CusA/SilA
MVDAAVVMIENAHKKVEAWHVANPGEELKGERHWHVMTEAAAEVGPALFFCLLIITLSFIPVFTLEAQEGRLFGPLAFTKTYAMAAAAGLSVTLVPVLMGYWIRGRIPNEQQNPLNRWLIRIYEPALDAVLRRPKSRCWLRCWSLSARCGRSLVWVVSFFPAGRGDLLYMPSALPGLSAQKAAQLLQQTDRLIKTVPEVEHVSVKPAALKPRPTRHRWKCSKPPSNSSHASNGARHDPGKAGGGAGSSGASPRADQHLDTADSQPYRHAGHRHQKPDWRESCRHQPDGDRCRTQAIERVAKDVPGVSSALAERLTGGRYIDVDIDRKAAARYGLNIADVQSIVAGAIGGENVGETIEGLARFPINVRYPREWRDSLGALEQLPIYTPLGSQITLGTVAKIKVSDGPPMLKSENARPSGWVYIDVRGRDIASVVADLRRVVSEQVKLQPGMSLSYSGQFEFLERANARLKLVVPATLLIIFVLLYLTFARLMRLC